MCVIEQLPYILKLLWVVLNLSHRKDYSSLLQVRTPSQMNFNLDFENDMMLITR